MLATLGERLKFLRGKTSQASFAGELGLPQATLSNYERNRNEPGFATIRKICTHFGVNVEWLLFGTGVMSGDAQGGGMATELSPSDDACRGCRYYQCIESIVKTEHQDLRELSQEVRRLYQENARLERENGNLREKLARLDVSRHS